MISVTMMLCIKFHFLTDFRCVQNGFVKYYVLCGAGSAGNTVKQQLSHFWILINCLIFLESHETPSAETPNSVSMCLFNLTYNTAVQLALSDSSGTFSLLGLSNILSSRENKLKLH